MRNELADLSPLGRQAIWYARRGWHVFPLYGIVDGKCECGDPACGKTTGKHPRVSGGFHAGSTDAATIAEWWRRFPNSNIGVACEASGLFVLDVDAPGNGHGDGDGPATLARLEEVHGPLPQTPEARMTSGGRHVYFKAPADGTVPSRSGIAPGLDSRATGGYIVAPPSRHRLGGEYAWLDGTAPADLALAPAPAWLVDLARQKTEAPRPSAGGDPAAGAVLVEGQRDEGLFRWACSLRQRSGLEGAELEAAVLAHNATHCQPPLPEAVALAKARSAARYPAGADDDNDDGPAPWPELAPEGKHGLAWEIVEALDPYSEADPVGVLAHVLAGFGNMVGRAPHFPLGAAAPVRANLFVALLGTTAIARKGTAWYAAKAALEMADHAWANVNVSGGLSSGEGLVHAVRDASPEKTRKSKTTGEVHAYREDEGVTDKRRLFLEEELVRVLSVGKREGATISQVIRDAFGGGTLRVTTRINPLVATEPHVSIVGHATAGELVEALDVKDVRGGLVNRFLWIAVRSSKLLPVPPMLPRGALEPLAHRLRLAAQDARKRDVVTLTPEAEERWRAVYPLLARPAGPLAEYLSRGPAHTWRAALTYALLDGANRINLAHLDAALALWRYSEATVERFFGAGKADPLAGKVLDALANAPEGLPRKELRLAVGRPKAARFNATLGDLEAARKIDRARGIVAEGRPPEVWRLATVASGTPRTPQTPPVLGYGPNDARHEPVTKCQELSPDDGAADFVTLPGAFVTDQLEADPRAPGLRDVSGIPDGASPAFVEIVDGGAMDPEEVARLVAELEADPTLCTWEEGNA